MSLRQGSLKARAVSTFLTQGNRPGQEDHLIVDREKGIFIIADGFGGPIPGAQAAKAACDGIRGFLFKEAGDRDATFPFVLRTYFSLAGNVLFNSLIYANRKLIALNKGKDVHERGGASVLAGYMDGDLLALANVGLCNAWLLREGSAVQLVMPRNFGQLCDPFQSEIPEELRVPLIALGMSVDLEPEIVEYRIKPNDWLILATDGIPRHAQAEILNIQQIRLNPDSAIQQINSVLGHLNYSDNGAVSVIIF